MKQIDFICVSPNFNDNKMRCTYNRIGESMFCELHSRLFKTDYLKYKNLETYSIQYLNKYPLSYSTNIRNLLKIYHLIDKSYKLRIQFREKAFMPETWDVGHDLQINYLYNQLIHCENIIEEKFKANADNSSNDDDDDSNQSNQSDEDSDEDDNYTPSSYNSNKKKQLKTQLKIQRSRLSKTQIAAKWNDELTEFLRNNQLKRQQILDKYTQAEIEACDKYQLPYLKGLFYFTVAIKFISQYKLYRCHGVTVISRGFTIKTDKFESFALMNDDFDDVCRHNSHAFFNNLMDSPKYFMIYYNIYSMILENKLDTLHMRLFLFKHQRTYYDYFLWFYDFDDYITLYSEKQHTKKNKKNKMSEIFLFHTDSCKNKCCLPFFQTDIPTFDDINKVDACVPDKDEQMSFHCSPDNCIINAPFYQPGDNIILSDESTKYDLNDTNRNMTESIIKYTRRFQFISDSIKRKVNKKITKLKKKKQLLLLNNN